MDKNKPSLRVLFLTDGLAPFVIGGMQQHSSMLIRHLAPLVRSITVMHCGPINGAPPKENEAMAVLGNPQNVELFTAAFQNHSKLPGHYLRASQALSERYLTLSGDLSRFDVVYAQGFTADAFHGKHPKIMVNLHGLEMFQRSFGVVEWGKKCMLKGIGRRQLKRAWRVVSLGGTLTELVRSQGVAPGNIVEIPNAVEAKWFVSYQQREKARRKEAGIRFAMVGRNEHRKGLHILKEALTKVATPLNISFVGDWPRWDGGIHKLNFCGILERKEDVMACLDTCDVLLVPSLAEGMPTVILEAQARGLHVVASDVGAVRVLVKNPIPPGDPDALAEALLACVDPKNRSTALNLPIGFTWEAVALATCEALAASHGQRFLKTK